MSWNFYRGLVNGLILSVMLWVLIVEILVPGVMRLLFGLGS